MEVLGRLTMVLPILILASEVLGRLTMVLPILILASEVLGRLTMVLHILILASEPSDVSTYWSPVDIGLSVNSERNKKKLAINSS